MEFNKDSIYSKKGFFWINTYHDENNDIYFCIPKNMEYISKFYEKEYWDNFSNRKNNKKSLTQSIVNFFNIWNMSYISDFILLKKYFKINKIQKILEIWVWMWKSIKHLYRRWYNIKWLEIDNDNVKSINTELNDNVVNEWNYELMSIKDKYNLIYLKHVLEHFFDINSVIKKLYDNLETWWVVYINVPNASSKTALDLSINKHPHIYHFTEKSLKNIFEEKWFKSLHIWTYNFIRKNRINDILKSIFYITNIKKDNKKDSEFLIWIFKK